jgi:hypothetical protein
VNSRVLTIALGLVVVAAAVGYVLFPARPAPAPATEADVASPPSPPTERPSSPPQPPPAVDAPRVERRPATKPVDPGPETAAASVEAAPATATLTIDSDVAGAEVFLDRNFLGVTPLTVPNVMPGPHRLNVTATGYEGISETIEVAPGPREITVAFKVIRLDARIGVVHKHGVGSCAGTLSATPDGLRYDTPNRGDAFTVPLNGVDTFVVDYLAKNLRVKVKNGKTYNFTDPDGNADRLFVFHRDVEKVRARLAEGQ